MKLHREVLTEKQRHALEIVGPSTRFHDFYLAGGTAIALRLGHRRSVDLDWFSDARFGDPALLAAALRTEHVPFKATMMAEGTLYGALKGVPASFLHYPYRRLHALGRAREGFGLASLDDLATMKLSAIVDRGSKKDFIDVYALATRHRPLQELIQLYEQRFRTADIGHVLVALSYFTDAEGTAMPNMVWKLGWPTVRKAVEMWVRDAARRL